MRDMLDAAYAHLVETFREGGSSEHDAVRLVDEFLLPERERVSKQNARAMQSLLTVGGGR